MSVTAIFKFTKTLRRLHQGPLGIYVDELVALLEAQGYSRKSTDEILRVVADFSRWLYGRRLGVGDVDADRVRSFLVHRRRTRSVGRSDPAALRKMLDLLYKKGVGHIASPPKPVGQCERAKEDFARYLLQERGLSAATLKCYLPVISQFLAERFEDGAVKFEALVPTDVVGFVQRHARGHHSHSRAQLLGKALRAFLRHLRHEGRIAIDLAACVPAVAKWSLSELPKCLAPGQVRQVLNHCDRKTPMGRRDYAMLLLLARLGLRAGEVAALTFDQINWEQGHLTIRGKGGRWTQLPLPGDVGEAIAEYLISARPSCVDRRVFIRAHAPHTGFADATSVSTLVARTLVRAGIDPPRKGAHVFRHTLATEMLRRGASLFDIGQLLRHQNPDTTRIYAKVDLLALRSVALPWPGGER
jgi:site-specific recombinase XerD